METGPETPFKISPEESYKTINSELQTLHDAGMFTAFRMISQGHNRERQDFRVIRTLTQPETSITTPDIGNLIKYMNSLGYGKVPQELSTRTTRFDSDQKINRVTLRLKLDDVVLDDPISQEKYRGHDLLEAFADQDGSITVSFLRKNPDDARILAVEQKRFERKDLDPKTHESLPAALYITKIYDDNKLPPEKLIQR